MKTGDPEYRRQRAKGRADRAFVELDGRRHYLGAYGSPESREKFHRLLVEWRARGCRPEPPADDLRVVELVDRYLVHADGYYRRPDGTTTKSAANIRDAVRPLLALYGRSRVGEFGPRGLKAVRSKMVAAGLARSTVNRRIGMIKRCFKWGVAEELVEPAVYQRLHAVEGLRAGRTEAPDRPPVRAVPQAHVDAVRPHVSRQVWALVELQLYTGARSGELVIMRSVDIDMTGRIWVYRPTTHKTAHHGAHREIYLGPRAQRVVRPFLADRPLDAFLFSPRDAERERLVRRHAARTTPLSCGNVPGSNRAEAPRRQPGERYTPNVYAIAIKRACKAAGVPHWHPHQLRHAAATNLRREFGLETAKAVLGHRVLTATLVYAEADRKTAMAAVEKFG